MTFDFSSLGVVLAVVVGSAVVIYLAKLLGALVKKSDNSTLEQALGYVKLVEKVIKGVIGEKWDAVYDCAYKALSAVADGDFTKEEALANVRDVFDTALTFTNTEIPEAQKQIIYGVLESAVDFIMRDKVVAAKALSLSVRT